jgi:hypothetical protein
MHVYKQAGTIFKVCVKLRYCKKQICVNIQDVRKSTAGTQFSVLIG